MIHEKEKVDHSTGEIKQVNANFFQVYKDNVAFLIDMNKENKTALNVFLWIAKNMDDKNALVVSQEALSNALGVTTRTIQYAIAYLKDKKALEIIKSGSSNIYALNSKIVWQDDADKKKYAHFTAKVYVTAEEQDIDYQTVLFGHATKKEKKVRRPSLEKTEAFY
jgi:biotin operon repressor